MIAMTMIVFGLVAMEHGLKQNWRMLCILGVQGKQKISILTAIKHGHIGEI